MAKLAAYTIFDQAAGSYHRPFFAPADGMAIRSFTDIACDKDHEIGKHPEHYSLHRCGIFDDQKAVLIPEDRECLITALEAVARSRQIQPGSLQEFDDNVIKLSPGGTD